MFFVIDTDDNILSRSDTVVHAFLEYLDSYDITMNEAIDTNMIRVVGWKGEINEHLGELITKGTYEEVYREALSLIPEEEAENLNIILHDEFFVYLISDVSLHKIRYTY